MLQAELPISFEAPFYPRIHLDETTVVMKSGGSIHVWNWGEKTRCRWNDPEQRHNPEVGINEHSRLTPRS